MFVLLHIVECVIILGGLPMYYCRHHCLFLLMSIVFVLSGCLNRSSPEEKIFKLLENVASIESEFGKQQTPIVKLEENEKKLYDQIIQLGMKEFDQIVKLSDDAITNAHKRKEAMNKERESIIASQKEFEKLDKLIGDLKDDKLKKQAQHLKKLMTERYKSYEKLYNVYMESIEKDLAVYESFKKEDLTIDELQKSIDHVNASYDQVFKANNQYNKITAEYNNEKMDFYKNAKMDVTVEK
jgi:hypothetical protein